MGNAIITLKIMHCKITSMFENADVKYVDYCTCLPSLLQTKLTISRCNQT